MKTGIKLSFYLTVMLNTVVYAEVMTDGTVGARDSLSGQMEIPQSLGTTVGGNLFHSFNTFNINTGESATFTGSDALKNVISRVTGGTPSNIDGLWRSTIGYANFYFVNPAGIAFGVNANVDVPAAFQISTADTVHFTDGSQFSATDPTSSQLSIAEPASFGFLGSSLNNSSIEIKSSQLELKTGSTLDLVAGDITVDNAKLSVTSGEIRLVAIRGEGTVSLERTDNGALPLPAQTPLATNGGKISADASNIITQGDGSGRVALWGNEVTFNGSTFNANNDGDTNASSAKGIEINAHSLTAKQNTLIRSDSLAGLGKSGDVNVTAGTLDVSNGSSITTDVYADGDGGDAHINAQTMRIDGQDNSNFTGVSSDAVGGNGNSGNVTINANTLDMLNVAAISSSTLSSGKGGDVVVTAKALTIDGQNHFSTTGIHSATTGTGNAGSVYVKADTLNLLNAGTIFGTTYSKTGNAANVTVDANTIKIDGQGSPWWTGILSQVVYRSTGKGGLLSVNTKTLEIMNGGSITSASCNGDCSLNTDSENSDGEPGDVIINALAGVYMDHGKISTSTSGKGTGGDLQINSPLLILKNNSEISALSGSIVNTGLGDAGNITVNSNGLIYLRDSGFLTSVSDADSNGGNIHVNAGVLVMDTGVIQANAVGGSGGDIDLHLKALIPSHDLLIKGGIQAQWQPYIPGFNVIQAASEYGISGAVNVTSPQLNISGSVSGLNTAPLIMPVLENNLCQNSAMLASTLLRGGKGGLPADESQYGFIPPLPVQSLPKTSGLNVSADHPAALATLANFNIQPGNPSLCADILP